MPSLEVVRAIEKGIHGQRLTPEEACALIEDPTPAGVHELGRAALANRSKRFGRRATYVFNVQINPANICCMQCTFCNYAASANDAYAYVLEESEILDQIRNLRPTEAHIVGGLNQVWPYERNLALIQTLRREFPELYIKAYTAVEIAFFAETTGRPPRDILSELITAGVESLTGGGAEIFSERLHQKHWKRKIGPREWLRIHRHAHELGLQTNATMLFGFGETWEERVGHLLMLREAQNQSRGFSCFIPLPYQPGSGQRLSAGPGPGEILAVIALARLILDNIPHLKSYWPMTGLATGAAGLSWGADDMDGTIGEERIAHLAGAETPVGLAREQMEETNRMAGFTPAERNGQFQIRDQRAGRFSSKE